MALKRWSEPGVVSIPEALQKAVGGHPLVSQVLVKRGLTQPQTALAYLDPTYHIPSPANEFPSLDLALERLQKAIKHQETICVWGDYDVDGQTATTLLVSALQELGGRVVFHLPVRAYESHGINLPSLKRILDQGANLVLTCDTGISAHAALDYALQRRVDVIVTDHHELPAELPKALAIISSRLLHPGHALSSLPGVGVAYKLVEGLYEQEGIQKECNKYLDLVALGIVADVAELLGDTRYLLQLGLLELHQTHRLGLQALIELMELELSGISEEHLGYQLCPCLNALGRLEDANQVVEFFTTQDLSRARILALKLVGLNEKRKLLTNQVFQGALAQVEHNPNLLDEPILVLSNAAWPAGIIGIVANRLVERFHKPTITISEPPDKIARGSARSVHGINISAAIATQRDLLESYGGHPMAAGFSIQPANIPEFHQGVSRAVSELFPTLLEETIQIEAFLPLSELTFEFASQIERLAPFGAGSPPPIIATQGVRLLNLNPIGRGGEHLQLSVEDEHGMVQRLIWWQGASYQSHSPLPKGKFDLAYTVRTTTFRGAPEVQVEFVDFRQVEDKVIEITQARVMEIIDFRQELHQLPILKKLQEELAVQVWCEGESKVKLAGYDRTELQPADTLAIGTIPMGHNELAAVIAKVSPSRLYLFAFDPGSDELRAFLRRLAGVIKYVLRTKEGKTSLIELAASTAQREITVHKGLTWLVQKGYITIVTENEAEVVIKSETSESANSKQVELTQLETELKTLLQETAAFRSYYRRVNKDCLLLVDSSD